MTHNPWAELEAHYRLQRQQERQEWRRSKAELRAEAADADRQRVRQIDAANRQGAWFAFPLRHSAIAAPRPWEAAAGRFLDWRRAQPGPLPDRLTVRRTGRGRPRKTNPTNEVN